MRQLSLAARLYLFTLWTNAAVIGAVIASSLSTIFAMPWFSLAMLVALIIAHYSEVTVEAQSGHRVSFAVQNALFLLLVSAQGFAGSWVVALATLLFGALQRRPWERTLFNAASYFLSYCCACLVYTLLQPTNTLPYSGPAGLLTFFAVAGAVYLSNVLMVSLMVALATGKPVLAVYRQNMGQVSWVELLTFTIGASLAALWAVDPWLAVYGALTLVIAQRTFAAVVALSAETRRRQELAEERAKLYEELHRQAAELTRASRLAALGTLSAGIAHEFNNVLTAVIGHAQVGQLTQSSAEKDYSLNVIGRVSERATSITASLLTFARQREPDLGLNYLQAAIDDTLALVSHDLRKDQISVVRQLADLPPVLCDPGQIAQVLLNLITNARDALRERGGGELRLALAHEDEHAVITVADNGSGIPPELLDTIFQPFVTTKKQGNGLGMAICYGIVEGHRGKISIHSTVGQGTTVTVRLPMGSATAPSAEPPSIVTIARA